MQVRRILHVSHSTPDLDVAERFYGDVLGLRAAARPTTIRIAGAWFDVGDASLHLNARQAGPPAGGPHPLHTCLGVADLDEAVQTLRRHGVAYTEAGSLASRQIWLLDPSGNTLELQQDSPS